jgi:hypothetical protein
MKDCGIVRGDAVQACPLVIGKDTVYVHTDINQVPGKELWEYREIQYGKDEYIQMMAEKNIETENLINAILGAANDE